MKRILITGKDSYIGTSVEHWLLNTSSHYHVTTIDVKDQSWKNHDFSSFDVVFHVAGIAHIKETVENKPLYFKVNRDLVFEIASKAKHDGVKQFIFLSTMSVYGLETGVITLNTPLKPNTAYGISKLEAEQLINPLSNQSFKVAVLRPPMVYGHGSRGNYTKLSQIAKKTPIFPNLENRRSMIYIDNLSEYIRFIVDQNLEGLFFPQNDEYVSTSAMVSEIARVQKRRIILTRVFNPLIKILNIKLINKVFGSLVYDMDLSVLPSGYMFTQFHESIKKTEMGQ